MGLPASIERSMNMPAPGVPTNEWWIWPTVFCVRVNACLSIGTAWVEGCSVNETWCFDYSTEGCRRGVGNDMIPISETWGVGIEFEEQISCSEAKSESYTVT